MIVLPDGVDQRVSYSSSDTNNCNCFTRRINHSLEEKVTVIITLNSTIRPTVVVPLEMTVVRPASIGFLMKVAVLLAVGEKIGFWLYIA